MFNYSEFKIYATGDYQFEFYTNANDGKCGIFRTSFYDVAIDTISNWLARGINFELKVISIVKTYDMSVNQLSFFN